MQGRYNKPIRFIFISAFLILLITNISKVKFDNSLKRWIPESSSKITDYEDFQRKFGGNSFFIVALHKTSGFNREDLVSIIKFQQQLKKLAHVRKVKKWPYPFLLLKKIPAINVYCITVSFIPPSFQNPNRPELLEKIKNLLEQIPVESHLVGTGVIHKAINEETKQFTLKFLLAGLLVLFGLLLFVLKNPWALALSITVSMGGVGSMFICSALLNIPLNLVSTILPILILFYSTSGSLHLFFHNGDFKRVLTPIIMTMCTTAAGFTIFLMDKVPLLRDFAIIAISGLIGGLLWAMILFFPGSVFFKSTTRLSMIFLRFRPPLNTWILILCLILVLVMIPGMAKIKSNIHSLSVLSPSHPSAVDHYFVEKHVGNYIPLEYMAEINSKTEETLERWISTVYKLNLVNGVMSYLNFLELEDAQKNGYVSKNKKYGRVTFLIPLLSSSQGITLAKKIDTLAKKEFGNYFQARYFPKITGYATLYAVLAEELGKSFRKSLIIAFILIFSLIFIYLRDIRLFMAAIFPNMFPIATILGVMGWFNISLDMVTVPIGCLLLGIIVDDTIHFLYWFKKKGELRFAFKEAGPGIFFTTLILVIGFSIFLFSISPPVRHFGILSITALLTALMGDLILLPIIINIVKKKIITNKIKSFRLKGVKNENPKIKSF